MTVFVAAVGAHSTGKTTLVEKLYELLKDKVVVATVMDLARELPRDELGSLAGQMRIFTKMYSKMKELDGEYDLVICDRGFLDVIAYYVHNGWMFGWNEDEFIAARDQVGELLEADRIFFDYYVFCPIENFELVDDGFRFTDSIGRCVVDLIIYSLLESGQRRYTVYRVDNVDEIVKDILEMVRNEDE